MSPLISKVTSLKYASRATFIPDDTVNPNALAAPAAKVERKGICYTPHANLVSDAITVNVLFAVLMIEKL
jgi:hypothetical protein